MIGYNKNIGVKNIVMIMAADHNIPFILDINEYGSDEHVVL